ncbi:DUF6531 domain-containing protein [Streptomyces sp. MRC013]|uniref:DUF6531 domain-containing protein n=1 Tax=Streptomyces sp. MRC013 TaxID=2898276 RepID=UPI0020274D74|nr:DUF6531 domain-containing protein [Streptomyces sp. MRC013]URM91998.1 DUF6531 domain-containing protein [Streptomyces sp. MRC013]
MIPEGVDTMLDVIGVGWSNADEDAYREMADALREFADDADDADDAGTAYAHVQTLLSSGRSESLTALDDHWSKVQGKHKDLAKAARLVAGALDRVADIIVARKIAAVGEPADLCATVGITPAFAPVTAGLSTLLAGAKIAATRVVFKQIMKEMADAAVAEIVATLTAPAVAAIEDIVADLAIQTALDAAGVQNGYDTGRTARAGKDGLQLDSAGPGGGPGGGPKIDHDAHGNAATHLASVQITMKSRAGGKLGRAKGHHGRAKGKDSLTAVLDTSVEGITEKLTKALDDLGDHIGKKVPDPIKGGSKTHRETDGDVRDRQRAIAANDRKDGDGGPDRRHGGSEPVRRRRPTSTREALDRLREVATSLLSRRCKTDPVDVASGETVMPQTDLVLPGVLPLALRRTHISGHPFGHCFGSGWASTLDERPEMTGAGVAWAREDGSVLFYPAVPTEPGQELLPVEGERLPLVLAGRGVLGDVTYAVTDPRTGLTRRFAGNPHHSGLYWLTDVEDRNGNAYRIDRSEDGLPVLASHDAGHRVRVGTDPQRGVVTTLDVETPEGPVRVASFGYDADRNLESVAGSSGVPLRLTYDEHRRVTSWTDRNGHTYAYVYDAAGRVVETIGPGGALSSRFSYDTEARVTRFTCDAADRLVRAETPTSVLALEFDAMGRLLAETVDGRPVRFGYDAHGELVSRTTPTGAVTTYGYDESGDRTRVAVAGHALDFSRDLLGRELARTFGPSAAPVTLASTWDAIGRLTSQTVSTGRRRVRCRAFGYRADGLLVSATDELRG